MPLTNDAAALEAAAIAAQLGYSVSGIERMSTGLCHYVFQVGLRGGGAVVIRLARPQTAAALRGGVVWHGRLAAAGVPVPALLHHSVEGDRPWMVIERLPGRDLLYEVAAMSHPQLRALAREMVAVQARVATLPRAGGFGFAVDYGDSSLKAGWEQVVEAGLERSRQRISQSGACDPAVVDAVTRRLPAFEGYFGRIEPIPFLDDTTTKNVIVCDGRLSGIVDTDHVCFGDRLYTLGLTAMALRAQGLDPVYLDAWCDALALDRRDRAAVGLYTAVFCVDFLGEIGQVFNRDAEIPEDRARAPRLLAILDELLRRIDEAGGRS